jgi:GxxExxY protein
MAALMSNDAHDIEALITVAMDCGFAIHRALGPGLLESAYEALMAAALEKRGLRVERQKPITLVFENIRLDDVYKLDLLIEDQLIIELKSTEKLSLVHEKQLLTYLRITNRPLGLLMNFGQALMADGISRVINDRSKYRGRYASKSARQAQS